MSAFADKVTAVRAFLINRAQLRRLTNHEELQRVTGQLLFNGGRRSTPFPVSRESIVDVLKAVDDDTTQNNHVMLSALVVHFFDNEITPRFFESAIQRGLLPIEASEAERQQFHADQIARAYNAYPAVAVPADLSQLFPQEEQEKKGTLEQAFNDFFAQEEDEDEEVELDG